MRLLRLLLAIAVLPGMLMLAGCDDNGSGMDDPDPDPDPSDPFSVAIYDTTTVDGEQGIVVSDEDGSGIAYTDPDGNEVGTPDNPVVWTSDNVYQLDGFIFVNEGQALTIEPGTVIKGSPGTGENASALIVARGGTINASGNADNPIIFTALGDNVSDPADLPSDARGLWGGVIILGSAPLNSQGNDSQIEGIPTTEPRGGYGGDDADDNSGTFEYVSIRHGGSNIGAGNEINGLTMGGVGTGTTIQYVEVFNNEDDGFEWFGGTVHTKYLVSAFNGDDSFDIDEGFSGNGQFWFALQNTDEAGRIAEQDGGTDPEDGQPYATPRMYNVTYVGISPGTTADGDSNDPFLYFRDNNASSYYNSIFMDAAITSAGLHIEDLAGNDEDSRKRFEADQLQVENNLWFNIGTEYDPGATVNPTTFEDIIQVTLDDNDNPVDASFRGDLAQYLRDTGNSLETTSPVTAISRSADGGLNPLAAGNATSGAPAPNTSLDRDGVNGAFDNVGYYGAFGTDNWAAGWTFLSEAGYFAN